MVSVSGRMPSLRSLPVASVRLGTLELGGNQSLICAPIVAADTDALQSEAREIARFAPDVVEWRADAYGGLRPDLVPTAIAHLRAALARPLIVTCRAASEGGLGTWSDAARLAVLGAALIAGADAVDVELATPGFAQVATRAAALGRPVILSEHHFDSTPETPALLHALAQQQEAGASAAKLAVMPSDATDVTRLLDACLEARRTFLRIPLIAMAMGQLGAFSRIVGPIYGIDLSFAVAARASAPGQLAIADLRTCRNVLGIP